MSGFHCAGFLVVFRDFFEGFFFGFLSFFAFLRAFTEPSGRRSTSDSPVLLGIFSPNRLHSEAGSFARLCSFVRVHSFVLFARLCCLLICLFVCWCRFFLSVRLFLFVFCCFFLFLLCFVCLFCLFVCSVFYFKHNNNNKMIRTVIIINQKWEVLYFRGFSGIPQYLCTSYHLLLLL